MLSLSRSSHIPTSLPRASSPGRNQNLGSKHYWRGAPKLWLWAGGDLQAWSKFVLTEKGLRADCSVHSVLLAACRPMLQGPRLQCVMRMAHGCLVQGCCGAERWKGVLNCPHTWSLDDVWGKMCCCSITFCLQCFCVCQNVWKFVHSTGYSK